MLREQRKIYKKLATTCLTGVRIADFKKHWECGLEYRTQENRVGYTAYFLSLQIHTSNHIQNKWTLSIRGYITIGTGFLTLVTVSRDVDANPLSTDEKCKETISWLVEEFILELETLYSTKFKKEFQESICNTKEKKKWTN